MNLCKYIANTFWSTTDFDSYITRDTIFYYWISPSSVICEINEAGFVNTDISRLGS
jgi:hypothetical protein